jgi:hypothetical protein
MFLFWRGIGYPIRFFAHDGLRRLVLPHPLETRMANPAVTGPSRELHLGDQLRLGPPGIFGVRPGGGDEGRCVDREPL